MSQEWQKFELIATLTHYIAANLILLSLYSMQEKAENRIWNNGTFRVGSKHRHAGNGEFICSAYITPPATYLTEMIYLPYIVYLINAW